MNWSYTFLVQVDSLMVTLLVAYLVVDMHLEVEVYNLMNYLIHKFRVEEMVAVDFVIHTDYHF